MSHAIDPVILAASARLLAEHGWAAVTLESVAEKSGVSRATLYRREVTRERIGVALAERAAAGWKDAIWPALTAAGSAADRLDLAVRASCAAIESYAGVVDLVGPNPVVDLANSPPVMSSLGDVFVDPFTRLLVDGASDGSLASNPNPHATATVIFTTISRGYLAARRVQKVAADEATDIVVRLILTGVVRGSDRFS